MVVCGIAQTPGRDAAALAVDGRLVAAAVVPRRAAVGPAARTAVGDCLAAAGLEWADVAQGVVVAHDAAGAGSQAVWPSPEPPSTATVTPALAHWRLAQAAGAGCGLVVDGGSAALADAACATLTDLPAARGLLVLAAELGVALGVSSPGASGADAIAPLELLASAHPPGGSPWFAGVLLRPDDPASPVVRDVFHRALSAAADEAGTRLDDAASPHVRAARVRAALGHAFLDVLAAHFAAVARDGGRAPMLSGSGFQSPDFVARVRRAAGAAWPVGPWPLSEGAAIGAALMPGPLSAHEGLGPIGGPPVGEHDAKAVIENCRLDYLYEPRWPRLIERVSTLLERGKLVAWFQGAAEFGHPLLGSRSILSDPSQRYARDNVNVFLRGCPASTPIPLSLARDAQACVESDGLSPWGLVRATVHESWRDALRAGVDHRGSAHVHVLGSGAQGPFADLLDAHRSRTGVPGLLNVPLHGEADLPAASPRDAIRAAFGSSVDALVLHRFLVVKDYWQMRADQR